MAVVKIKDATVARVNQTGFGVQVKEADREQGGKTFYGDRFTLWFKEPHGLTVGDVVSASGFLGAKVKLWTNDQGVEKQTIELSVNNPKLDGFPAPAAVPSVEPRAGNDESPF